MVYNILDKEFRMSELNENVLVLAEDKEDEVNSDFVDLSNQAIYTSPKDWTVSSLWEKYKKGNIVLQPDFQRKFVWDKKKASALIESILLGFPLPIIYLSEEENGKMIVIDGQQRLTSIFSFKDNSWPEGGEFKLTSLKVLKDLNKKRYSDLSETEQNTLDDYSIRTVVISKNSGKDIKFDMFERLNSGSVGLNDMELRNCVYRGEYMDTLKEFAKDPLFRELVGLREEEPRMKDVELVLRVLAFQHTNYLDYSAPMKKFLNDDCEKFKTYDSKQRKEDEERFKTALHLIKTIFDKQAFKRFFIDPSHEGRWEDKSFNINISLFDIYMWFFARQDKNKVTRNADLIREATMDLMVSDDEFIDSITRATSGNKQVKTRFDKFRQRMEAILDKDQTQDRCFTYALKEELYKKDPTCAICHNKIMSIDDAAVDHIEQFWVGGKTTPENARLTHRYCNNHRPRNDVVTDQKDE